MDQDSPDYDRGLFEKLRRLRNRIATRQNLPPYIVFSDATLQQMALWIPQKRETLSRVSGVGSVKLEQLGGEFLEAIRSHALEHGLEDRTPQEHARAYEKWSPEEERELVRKHGAGSKISDLAEQFGRRPGAIRSRLKKLGLWKPGVQGRSPTYDQTGRLFRRGLSVQEIARRRDLTEGTIVSHLEFLAAAGEELDLDRRLPPPERTEKIVAAFRELGGLSTALRPVKDRVGEDCSYAEIRLVRISLRQHDPSLTVAGGPEESP